MMTIRSIRLRASANFATRLLLIRAVDGALAAFERARQRRQLAALDERMLRDLGLSRLDAYRESTKPFWRV